MLSSANIGQGIMMGFVMLASILIIIIAVIVGLYGKKRKNKSETQNIAFIILLCIGVAGLMYAYAGSY
ncbi:hypothetical protein AWW73_08535 [Acinetobacter lactucae]|uniref:hypothetical protein n=1 Tax=Acinetobacter calcoaceticus/baumannii complex TaxID=909768 RepID=UPI0007A0768C|nr:MULTISPECIES: hypothetical protein [Acinetobacter calcoaceticus/baumannii complex]KYQ78621.1 hypothetical protein AWW73_08535 [Acinetobacter lactucae]RSP95177.1 hypothetical protein EA716_07720 [Acinetobacter baumannii]